MRHYNGETNQEKKCAFSLTSFNTLEHNMKKKQNGKEEGKKN